MIVLCLRQNEHNRAFGMLAARTSVIHIAKVFGSSRITVHSLVRRYKQTGISIDAPRSVDAPRLGEVGQLHQDETFNLLANIYASGLSRQR